VKVNDFRIERDLGQDPTKNSPEADACLKALCYHAKVRCGDVVQLVRTPACHVGGRGFEPRRPRHSPRAVVPRKSDAMNEPPKVNIENLPGYRENYANSVQIRASLWDFLLMFGLANQQGTEVNIQNYQGIYLSPQQAKALLNVLQQNITQYEAAFGEIRLEPGAVQAQGGRVIQ
jgi:hypothetical protein